MLQSPQLDSTLPWYGDNPSPPPDLPAGGRFSAPELHALLTSYAKMDRISPLRQAIDIRKQRERPSGRGKLWIFGGPLRSFPNNNIVANCRIAGISVHRGRDRQRVHRIRRVELVRLQLGSRCVFRCCHLVSGAACRRHTRVRHATLLPCARHAFRVPALALRALIYSPGCQTEASSRAFSTSLGVSRRANMSRISLAPSSPCLAAKSNHMYA